MARTIVFLHGAWVTAACWERMQPWFEARGYRTVAPNWPGKDRPVDQIRADPSALAGLGVGDIVASYEAVVRGLEEPPILIGHSFGGLFTQILLDRGLGAAGVAIDSAPPRGIWAFEPTAVRSLITVLLQWPWRKVARWKYSNFRYAFVSALTETDARAAYDRHVVPETIRIFFQSAIALVNPKSPIRVNFANSSRAPLLLIAGGKDRIVPPVINRRNLKAYAKSPAKTDFKEFPGRVHWIIAQDGWEEVAEHIATWLESQGLGPNPAS